MRVYGSIYNIEVAVLNTFKLSTLHIFRSDWHFNAQFA